MQLFLHLLWLQICCNHILGFPSLTFFARHSSTNLLYLLFILFGHQSHFNYQSNCFELSFSRISDSTLKWIFHVFLQWKNLLIHLTLPYGLFYNHCSLFFGCPSVCLFFLHSPVSFYDFPIKTQLESSLESIMIMISAAGMIGVVSPHVMFQL